MNLQENGNDLKKKTEASLQKIYENKTKNYGVKYINWLIKPIKKGENIENDEK